MSTWASSTPPTGWSRRCAPSATVTPCAPVWPTAVLDRLTRIPAGIAGIDPARKNEPAGLSVGARADLCVFDPEESWVVNEKTLWGQCTDTPWLGREVQGRVRLTAVGGRLVFTR